MIIDSVPVQRPSFVRSPLGRIFGSFIGWYILSLAMMLLLQSVFQLMSIGGSCASGGPYEIAVECPDAVSIFAPLSIIGGLLGVGVGIFLAAGFGVALDALAWPILFCGLGSGFLWEFFATGDPIGLILGLMFVIMGLVPLVLAFRVSVQRVFLGAVNYRGERFYEGEMVRRSIIGLQYGASDNPVRPTFGDWSLSLIVWLVAIGLGFISAEWLYAAVAGAGVGR
jgi:hypothetical protein